MRTRMNWTRERDEELKRLWAQGLSTSRIGDQLGVTKNAVVGRSHRLRLPSRTKVITTRGIRPVPKKQIRQGVSLANLNDDGCRWVLDDGLYCGRKIAKGRYCDDHAAASYVEARTPARSAAYPIRKRWS